MSREHVGIRYTDIDLVRERVMVSSIVAPAAIAASSPDLPPYVPYAMVPDPRDMRLPTDDELALFLATDSTPDAGLIEVVPPTSAALKAAVAKTRHTPGYVPTEPTVCAANQLTTTMSAQPGMRQGLHFDDSESPVAERMNGVRKLGFNKGPSTRFLLLGSIDIFDMWELYGDGNPEYMPGSETIGRYALAGGNVLCAYLAIEPGAVYLANVRAIAHDGSTQGQGPSTIHFEDDTWRVGAFGSLM